jgi:hypothetical protein
MITVVTGPDGSGKSTLLGFLKKRLNDTVFLSIDPSDLYPIPGVVSMDWATKIHPKNVICNYKPLTRSAFYIKTFSILLEYYIQPNLGKNIVIDSYWYRYCAKEISFFGEVAEPLLCFCAYLPKPDLIVELDIPLGEAFRRKMGIVSPFETYSLGGGVSSVIRLQKDVTDKVRCYTEGIEKRVVHSGNLNDNADEMQSILQIDHNLSESQKMLKEVASELL